MPLSAQIFDIDRLDKDGSKTADRAELLAALEGSEAARQAKLAEWGGEASTKDKLLKDIEELHEVTEEPETVYTGYEFGKRHGSKDTPDKQKWIRREIMPVSPRTRRLLALRRCSARVNGGGQGVPAALLRAAAGRARLAGEEDGDAGGEVQGDLHRRGDR